MGDQQKILPCQPLMQLLPRDLTVVFAPQHFTVVGGIIYDHVIIPRIGIPLIGQNRGKFARLVVFFNQCLGLLPFFAPKLCLADTTVVVVGQCGKIQLRPIPQADKIFIGIGSAVGKVRMPVQFAEIDPIFRRCGIIPMLCCLELRQQFLPRSACAAIDHVRDLPPPIGQVEATRLLSFRMFHKYLN